MSPIEHLPPQATRELIAALGKDAVMESEGVLETYSRDSTPLYFGRPCLVVAPNSTEEVAAVLAIATKYLLPVVPRGAGTNLCAATVPLMGGIVLVTSRMNKIIEVAPDELLMRVQPGVTTATVNETALQHGLFYPPDPGSHNVSTIGGNIATCAGGLRGLKYGVTRNYVLGLTVVMASGEVIRTGGRLWKDVAGYDLTRLLTGSEGTLGVITEATIALLPQPKASRSGIAYFSSLKDAGLAVSKIVNSGVIPATLEFLDRRCIDAVERYSNLGLDLSAGALLLFGDDGSPEQIERNFVDISLACVISNASSIQVAGASTESDALLAARRCTLPALSRLGNLTILEDASVPRPLIAEMVSRIDEISDRFEVTIATFGHAGDGNLHPTCVLESEFDMNGIQRARKAFDEIFSVAIKLGGTITGEHGVGSAKIGHLPERLGPEQLALLRRIKSAFDPMGILNPGKLGS